MKSVRTTLRMGKRFKDFNIFFKEDYQKKYALPDDNFLNGKLINNMFKHILREDSDFNIDAYANYIELNYLYTLSSKELFIDITIAFNPDVDRYINIILIVKSTKESPYKQISHNVGMYDLETNKYIEDESIFEKYMAKYVGKDTPLIISNVDNEYTKYKNMVMQDILYWQNIVKIITQNSYIDKQE